MAVTAVPEPAFSRERTDITEGACKTDLSGSNLELAHSWSIKQPRATRGPQQIASRGGVSPLVIGQAYLLSLLFIRTEQGVDERRFTDTR
jgi:hypothetical protein